MAEWRKPPTREYKPREAAKTSRMMAAVRNKNGRAEMLLRTALWRRGYRYRLHSRSLIGRPDLTFPKQRVAVFVDGDFWHGRALREQGIDAFGTTLRTSRKDWWIAKITKTVERDSYVTTELKQNGWTVLRFWESAVLSDVNAIVDIVINALHTEPQQPTNLK